MNQSSLFARLFFLILSLVFMLAFFSQHFSSPFNYVWGLVSGVTLWMALIGFDYFFRKFNLRIFNLVLLGLCVGYLMGMALLFIFNAIVDISHINPLHISVNILKISLFLFGTYLGVTMTIRAADEIYVSIPFVKFTPEVQKVKDILLDFSALLDARIIDLAAHGLLDKRLILPRFLLSQLHAQEEGEDDTTKIRAKRMLEVVKKLESMPQLQLRYQDMDFADIKDPTSKTLHLARLLNSDVLSADLNKVQMAQFEDIRIINLHSLSNALKPLTQRGEGIKIKIQRTGKEERQGIGYLEDGTMVVVNGGADFLYETIQATVLSVKHTQSGRIIFCNAADQDEDSDERD